MAQTLYNIDPANGKVSLDFHEGQLRAWDSTARIVAVISGTQGGKTSFGPWWLAREIQTQGGGDYLAVSPTYPLFSLKLLPELLTVFCHVLKIGRHWTDPGGGVIEIRDPETGLFWANKSTDPMYARIIMRSASSGSLESATAKAAWLDEAGHDQFGLSSWEAVVRRLSLARGRTLITTTPYNLGWLKIKVYDPWKRGDRAFDVIQFSSISNPAFSREEYYDQKARMDDWKFRMFYDGQFERPAGLIYNAYIDALADALGHKVDPFELDRSWPWYVGVDPGGANFCQVWLAHDPINDVYYLFHESLDGGKSTAQIYDETIDIRVKRSLGYGGSGYVGGWYMGQQAESQQRRDWADAGAVNVMGPPHNDVEAGITSVIEFFRLRRLFIFTTCEGTIEQLNDYRRVLDDRMQPTDKIHQKEKYHYLDALRYVIVGRSEPPPGDMSELPRRA